jgi:hypothetical protein
MFYPFPKSCVTHQMGKKLPIGVFGCVPIYSSYLENFVFEKIYFYQKNTIVEQKLFLQKYLGVEK